MNGKFYENNIVIQYDKDLIEVGQCQHMMLTQCAFELGPFSFGLVRFGTRQSGYAVSGTTTTRKE